MAQTPHGTFDYEPTRRGATPFLALTKPSQALPWRSRLAAELPNDYLIPQLVKMVQAFPSTIPGHIRTVTHITEARLTGAYWNVPKARISTLVTEQSWRS
jgi:hypothetical protein